MMKKEQRKYKVYKRIAPDGRVYIGCTVQNLAARAGIGGLGYRQQARLWAAIQEFGWAAFTTEIILITDSEKEAHLAEINAIIECDATNPDKGFNTEMKGYFDNSKSTSMGTVRALKSPEVRAKMSAAQYEKWSNPEYRAKTQAAMKAACNTPEHKAKMSEVGKEAQNRPEVKSKLSSAFSGLIFINNGFYSKRVTAAEAEQLIATGEWSRGRLPSGPRGPVKKLQDRVWINKEGVSKFIEQAELQKYLDAGWLSGRGTLNKRRRRECIR